MKRHALGKIDVAILSNEYETYRKTIQKIEKRGEELGASSGIDNVIKSVSNTLPIMNQLHIDKLREGHEISSLLTYTPTLLLHSTTYFHSPTSSITTLLHLLLPFEPPITHLLHLPPISYSSTTHQSTSTILLLSHHLDYAH
jgi:hypothetical protein